MMRRGLLAVLLPGLLCVANCNPIGDDNRSAVILSISSFATQDGQTVSAFTSDVVSDTLEPTDDLARLLFDSTPKSVDASLSSFYSVTLFAYQITYTRTDGKNEPGVDVPFPFTLSISGNIAPDMFIRALSDG